MQFKQSYPHPLKGCLFIIATLLISIQSLSQNTYLSQGAKENILIERLEILGQNDSILNFSKAKPWNRLQVVRGALSFKQNHPNISLSKTDEYNLQSLYRNNIEYLSAEQRDSIKSKKCFAC